MKPKKLSISNHIEQRWRQYANYVVHKRGIPNFYDGLTNTQRILINSAPVKFTKSVSVIGEAIRKGYAHGNASLENSMNILAKEFSVADNIFDGDGFFGTPVSDDAAAARYTAVRLNQKVSTEIKKYDVLNTVNEDGLPNGYHIDVPIGLCVGNTGIAIGFKSKILPRRLEDMKRYIETGTGYVKPYFKNFEGEIKRDPIDKSKWVIRGKYELKKQGKFHVITISEIPPTLRYETFVKKINDFLEKNNINSVKVSNESKVKIHLILKTSNKKDFDKLKKRIDSIITANETENIVFIRDGVLIQYRNFIDYLDDFREWKKELILKKYNYDLTELNFNLEFNEAKLKFLNWMIIDGRRKSRQEITNFLKKFQDTISNRLRQFPLYKTDLEEIKYTEEKILELKNEIKKLKFTIIEQKAIVEKSKQTKTKRIF
jgi:DNA gyrase/topoisomerase IV subunit A